MTDILETVVRRFFRERLNRQEMGFDGNAKFIYLDVDKFRSLVNDCRFRQYCDVVQREKESSLVTVMGVPVVEVRERDHFEILWEEKRCRF